MQKKITKKVIEYFDPILKNKLKLKVEKTFSKGKTTLKIALPEEKNFFRGVDFKEKVLLEKTNSGVWRKHLSAKFGEGAEELFGVSKLNEESELEARDIRIIAAVEKNLT